METLNPYLFIHIGLCIRALRHCDGLTNTFVATEEGEDLVQDLEAAGFKVSSVGVSKLKNFIDKIKSLSKTTLTQEEVVELKQIMGVVEDIVWAEASTKSIFLVSEKRYSLEVLMEYPENMFASGVFLSLPDLAQYDLREGFLCLTFSRATAAAFHLLRATEAVLKELYLLNIKRGRIKKPNWGDMTSVLKKRKNIDLGLIERLDYIRLQYRNPTDHPDLIYSIEDTENLLGLCIEVIGGISKILFKG